MIIAITYDLNKSGQDYDNLFKKIQSLGIAHHAIQNLWFLDTRTSLSDASSSLLSVMDKNDSLFICELAKNSYKGWLPQSSWDWLNSRL